MPAVATSPSALTQVWPRVYFRSWGTSVNLLPPSKMSGLSLASIVPLPLDLVKKGRTPLDKVADERYAAYVGYESAVGGRHMSAIEELLQGSIDMHVHFGPDPSRERRQDIVQLALCAQQAGMAGLVPKSHSY